MAESWYDQEVAENEKLRKRALCESTATGGVKPTSRRHNEALRWIASEIRMSRLEGNMPDDRPRVRHER